MSKILKGESNTGRNVAVANLVDPGGLLMQRAVDLVHEPDLIRLPKDVLTSFSKNFNVDQGLSMGTIVSEIWKKITQSRDYSMLESVLEFAFAGSTSIKWFKPREGYQIPDIEESVGSRIVFERGVNVELGGIQDAPILVGAAPWRDSEVAMRLVVKTRETRVVRGVNLVPQAATAVCTVIVDPITNLIEVRGDKGAAVAVAEHLSMWFRIPVTEMRPVLLGPFSDRIDDLANALGGRVAGTSSKPWLEIGRMESEEAEAIVAILSAITGYFESSDVGSLQTALDEAYSKLSNPNRNYAAIPFEAVVLAGLNKLAMNTGDDIRDLPFYGAIEPYVQHQGSRIVFDHGGQTHSVNVGFTTNSLFFRTKASETVIRYVRASLLGLLDRLEAGEANDGVHTA